MEIGVLVFFVFLVLFDLLSETKPVQKVLEKIVKVIEGDNNGK